MHRRKSGAGGGAGANTTAPAPAPAEAQGWDHREALRLTMPEIQVESLTGALVQAVDGALGDAVETLRQELCERAGSAGDHQKIASACEGFRRHVSEQVAPKQRNFKHLLQKHLLRVPDAVLGGPLSVRPADLIGPLRTLEVEEAGNVYMDGVEGRHNDAGRDTATREAFEAVSADLVAATQRGQDLQRESQYLNQCLQIARSLRATIDGAEGSDAHASLGAGLMDEDGRPMSAKQQMMLDLRNVRALAGAEALAGGA